MYSTGDVWTSGKARQGVYSSTRYAGAIRFSIFTLENEDITSIRLALTIQNAGGTGAKYLTLYTANSVAITGTVEELRGDLLGSVLIGNAYGRTVELTLDENTNSDLFYALRDYFLAGKRLLVLWVAETRSMDESGYCADYMAISAATLTLTTDTLASTGTLDRISIEPGETITLTLHPKRNIYSHKISWRFGIHSLTSTIQAGTVSAGCVFPLRYLDAIPNGTSGSASVYLQTLDEDGTVIGAVTYPFTVTVPDSVVPAITGITVISDNDDEMINEWGIFVQGLSRAKIEATGVEALHGASIASIRITTDPLIGTSDAASLTTNTLYQTGRITVNAIVTDSRGRSGTASTTFTVEPYDLPTISNVTTYRCLADGTRDDVNGTCVYFRAEWACSSLAGCNGASAEVNVGVPNQVASDFAFPESGDAVILGDEALDPEQPLEVFLLVRDRIEGYTPFVTVLPSAQYILHIKTGGKAIGIGTQAGDDGTATIGWKLRLNQPLSISDGGTGATSALAARQTLGAVSKSGDTMTGDLTIQNTLYPSLKLVPTWEGITNRTVFEGSYVGAASFANWEDDTGENRRMLELRNAAYESSLDNAVMLRTVIAGEYAAHRLFHAGMPTPIPMVNGGTGAATAKDALINLGIFYSDTLPDTGEDGQICLVPV